MARRQQLTEVEISELYSITRSDQRWNCCVTTRFQTLTYRKASRRCRGDHNRLGHALMSALPALSRPLRCTPVERPPGPPLAFHRRSDRCSSGVGRRISDHRAEPQVSCRRVAGQTAASSAWVRPAAEPDGMAAAAERSRGRTAWAIWLGWICGRMPAPSDRSVAGRTRTALHQVRHQARREVATALDQWA